MTTSMLSPHGRDLRISNAEILRQYQPILCDSRQTTITSDQIKLQSAFYFLNNSDFGPKENMSRQSVHSKENLSFLNSKSLIMEEAHTGFILKSLKPNFMHRKKSSDKIEMKSKPAESGGMVTGI